MDRNTGHIILFDGVCNLCNGFVRFLIERDRRANLRFGTLQSRRAAELLKGTDIDPKALETVVYLRRGQVLTRSNAALSVLADLGGGWSVFRLLLVLPAGLRDAVYEAIATRRYRWFGQRDTCMVPTTGVMERFLTDDQEPARMEAISGGK